MNREWAKRLCLKNILELIDSHISIISGVD
jgi:hypothetical protein